MRSILALLLLSSLLTVGCSKKSDDKSGGGGDKPAAGGLDMSAWDQAGKAKAWQGAWLVKENGTLQAWTVAGDQIQTWDGKEDKTYTLKLTAPCRAQFATANGMSMPREFSVVDGKLAFRSGGAGYRKGKEALFCDMSGDYYTVDAAGTCNLWEADDFDSKKVTKGPGVCGWKQGADGKEVFFHEGVNAGEFEIRGDAILASTSFETEKVEGDHAAAKAARDAKAAQ